MLCAPYSVRTFPPRPQQKLFEHNGGAVSLSEVGCTSPSGGGVRVQATTDIGLSEVPCTVVHFFRSRLHQDRVTVL